MGIVEFITVSSYLYLLYRLLAVVVISFTFVYVIRRRYSPDILMYILLFVCIFTSHTWTHMRTSGELIRFDRFLLMRQVNIYYFFAFLFFFMLLLKKFIDRDEINIIEGNNYLKNIFLMYFIPVNLLIYFSVYLKEIPLDDLGVKPIMESYTYLVVTYYVQDIFLKEKNNKQLLNILTAIEALIFVRCCYSIIKYLIGIGHYVKGIGLRLGQENDFADYFVLLFITALTRLLFERENSKVVILHLLSIIASSYIIIFSMRRYLWSEYFVAASIILSIYYMAKREDSHKKIILTFLLIAMLFSTIFVIGPDKLTENPIIGRFVTIGTLFDERFESEFGDDQGHRDELRDGWHNVKKHWLLGVTPFGKGLLERYGTRGHAKGSDYVHNAYLLIWIQYGLLGLILFVFLYLKSFQLGYHIFSTQKNILGLILFTFMSCQVVKNIVWATAIRNVNLTIIYILLISLVLRVREIEVQKRNGTINMKYSLSTQ